MNLSGGRGGSPEFILRVGLNFQLKGSLESFWGGWLEFILRVGLNFQLKSWS